MAKASRNKTIELTKKEISLYRESLMVLDRPIKTEKIVDSTVCGDINKVIGYLPRKFVDLLFVDPPYNLEKNFNGKRFKKSREWVQGTRDSAEKWSRIARFLLLAENQIGA